MKARSYVTLSVLAISLFISARGLSLNLTIRSTSSCQVVCEDLVARPQASRQNLTTSGDTSHNEASMDDGSGIVRMSLFSSSQNLISLLAEVSTTNNLFTKDDKTSSIEGIMSKDQTSIRVDFFDIKDCQIDYICNVLETDGRLNVRTTAQSEHGKESSVTSCPTGHIVAKSSDDLSAVSADQRLRDELSSSQQRQKDELTEISAQIESAKQSVESQVKDAEQRVRGEILNVEQRLKDDLTVVKSDITALARSAEQRQLDALSHMEQRLTSKVSDVGRNIQVNSADDFSEIQEKLDLGMKYQSDDVSSFSDSIASSLKDDITQINKVLVDSLSHNISVLNDTIVNTVLDQYHKFDNAIISFENRLDQIGDSIVSVGHILENNTIKEDISSFTETIREEISNMTCVSEEDQTILTHSLCKKGMLPITAPPPYPYPVFHPDKNSIIEVPFLCDTSTNFGGWILIHRRSTGKVEFSRDWEELKAGFGSLEDDFWLGLEAIYKLTSRSTYELRVDLKYKGKSAYALYSSFYISSEADNYRIHVGSYSGTAGDSIRGVHNQNGMEFTTRDRDHDNLQDNCAIEVGGPWWYNACHNSNLNGQWLVTGWKGVIWYTLTGADSVSFAEMKIRRVDA